MTFDWKSWGGELIGPACFATFRKIASLTLQRLDARAAVPRVSAPATVAQGEGFTLRVSLTQTAGNQPLQIESVDTRLTFDASKLSATAVRIGSGLNGGAIPPVLVPNVSSGSVTASIAVIDPRPLSEGMQLLEVDFVALSNASPGATKVSLQQLSINEGAISFSSQHVPPSDGVVNVTSVTTDTSGDAPLPPWSFVALGLALWLILQNYGRPRKESMRV